MPNREKRIKAEVCSPYLPINVKVPIGLAREVEKEILTTSGHKTVKSLNDLTSGTIILVYWTMNPDDKRKLMDALRYVCKIKGISLTAKNLLAWQ
jgi:hypothetical protein